MAHPVNTGITIKCHKKSSYRKINKLMEDEDFRAQFNDKTHERCNRHPNNIELSACVSNSRI